VPLFSGIFKKEVRMPEVKEVKQKPSSSPQPPQPAQKQGMSTGAKVGIGIGIGCFVLIVLIVVLVIVFASKAAKDVGEEIKKEAKQEEVKSEYTVGEPIKIGDKTLTVTNVGDFVSSNEFDQPAEGKERIMVGVTINNDSDQPISYNVLDFKVEDSNGNRTSDIFAVDVPNQLSAGELAPGGKVSGNMAFEIPAGESNAKLVVTPSFWTNKRVIIKL
jgi:Na+-transporting methylmalonyl-CoA/oxaloacetate decarboxylase gamma subunit